MELRQLECSAHAARNNNFSKAADELHISQPALSTCIRLLEDELDVKLFDRIGKKVKLNETGMHVLEHVNTILNECATIKQICKENAANKSNKVTILPAVTSWIIPFLYNDFTELHPDISLDIVIEHHTAYSVADEADIIIMATVDEQATENVQTVYKEEVMLAVPQGHDLAEFDEINLIDLKPYAIISLAPGRPLRTIEDHFCSLAGFLPKRSIECDSITVMHNLIEDGYGPAFVPVISWRDLKLPKSRLVHIKKPSCFRYISIRVNNKKRTKKHAISETVNYILSLLEQTVSG